MAEPEVMWGLVCDQFLVDQAGKYSIIGVWENLNALAFPALHPLMFIVSAWEGEPNTAVMAETRLWSPQQTLLASIGPSPLRFGATGRAVNVNQLLQIQFPIPGPYRIELLAAGVTKRHFDVQLGLLIQAPATNA